MPRHRVPVHTRTQQRILNYFVLARLSYFRGILQILRAREMLKQRGGGATVGQTLAVFTDKSPCYRFYNPYD